MKALNVLAWLFGVLACCTCGASPAIPLTRSDATPEEQALINWLQGLGADVGVAVRRDPTTGVRGLAAASRRRAGDVLVRVPLAAALALGTAEQTAPELAIQMLRERYRTRPRYGPYFDVLPPPPPPPDEEGQGEDAQAVAPGEEGLQRGVASGGGWQPSCVEEFPAEAVEALAGTDLRSLATAKREWMRQVWAGEGEAAAALRLPLARAVPRRRVSLAEFAWATCMVTSRSIAGPPAAVGSTASSTGIGTGTSSQPATMLLIPLIDLANHCTLGSSGANRSSGSVSSSTAHGSSTTDSDGSSSTGCDGSSRGRSGDVPGRSTPDVLRFRTEGGAAGSGSGTMGRVVLELVAGQDLEAGQEVCISYGDLRPDESLLYYGFLPPMEAAAAVAVAEAAAEAAAPGGGDSVAEASGRQQCSGAAGESAAAALPGGGSSTGGGGSSSSGREGSCEWDGGADPVLQPGLQLLPLAAVDEMQYDSAARPGKGSYSRLGMEDEGMEGQGDEGAASRGLQWVEAVEAEAKRLKARLTEVVAEAEAAWAGPAAGCPRLRPAAAATSSSCRTRRGGQQRSSSGTQEAHHHRQQQQQQQQQQQRDEAPVCLTARLNAVRAAALRAELDRLEGLLRAAI